MKIVTWHYDMIDAYDNTTLSSGTVQTTDSGTRQQAIGKAVFQQAGKSGIQIGWKIKMARKPITGGETKMGTVKIEIKLGNDGMLNHNDVVATLHELARKIEHDGQYAHLIRDINGNVVGKCISTEN